VEMHIEIRGSAKALDGRHAAAPRPGHAAGAELVGADLSAPLDERTIRGTRRAIPSTASSGRASARSSAGSGELPHGDPRGVLRLRAPELVELEVYLLWRARGMPVETPTVRP
jgi:hypothetical protein